MPAVMALSQTAGTKRERKEEEEIVRRPGRLALQRNIGVAADA
jgi:hypothetical protein